MTGRENSSRWWPLIGIAFSGLGVWGISSCYENMRSRPETERIELSPNATKLVVALHLKERTTSELKDILFHLSKSKVREQTDEVFYMISEQMFDYKFVQKIDDTYSITQLGKEFVADNIPQGDIIDLHSQIKAIPSARKGVDSQSAIDRP